MLACYILDELIVAAGGLNVCRGVCEDQLALRYILKHLNADQDYETRMHTG